MGARIINRQRVLLNPWEFGSEDIPVQRDYGAEIDELNELISRTRDPKKLMALYKKRSELSEMPRREFNPAGEIGKTLSPRQKQLVLESMKDVYKVHRLDKEEKGIDARGETIWGYPYAPEYFETSNITGAKIRYYITLPDGRIAHPTEIYPNVKQSDIDRELEARRYREKQEEEWIQGKLGRIVKESAPDAMQTANILYYKRGRSREGSYFAYDGRGNLVRVDGNDPRDVQFFEERGFRAR